MTQFFEGKILWSPQHKPYVLIMMTSSNGNIFRVTGHLCGEFTGPRSPVNSPHKGQWRGALMFSLICAWITAHMPIRRCRFLNRRLFFTFRFLFTGWRHRCFHGNKSGSCETLQWRHNDHDSVSNHQPAIVYSTVYSEADQRLHQSSALLAFVWGIHRWPVNSPPKRPVTRKMFPFDDVIMIMLLCP